MSSVWIALLSALFLWWFSTGVILVAVRWADRRGGSSHAMTVIAGVPVLALGILALIASLNNTGVSGAYQGFLAALAIWGFIELTFLTGVVTGPNRAACPQGVAGMDRLWRAWSTVSHHELLLLVGLLALVIICQGAANGVALWTYLVLFLARIGAKLNLFLGVPRINTEFVPRPLAHLSSYFRKGPITLAFPVAITALTFGTAWLGFQLWGAETAGAQVRFALLTGIAGLALLEHWLMVVPLPDAKLWRWMLPAPNETAPRLRAAQVNTSER